VMLTNLGYDYSDVNYSWLTNTVVVVVSMIAVCDRDEDYNAD